MIHIINILGALLGISAGLFIGVAGPVLLAYAVRRITGNDIGIQLAGYFAILSGPIGIALGAKYGSALAKIVNNPEQGWNYFLHGYQGWAGSLFFLIGIISIFVFLYFFIKSKSKV